MKKRIFLIFILFILLYINSTTLIQGEQKKLGEINGYFWEKENLSFKFGYIKGLSDGVIQTELCYRLNLGKRKFTKEFIQKLEKDVEIVFDYEGATYDQVVNGIDELYKDYANKMIPVHFLMSVVCRRTRGAISKEEMEKELQGIRALVSKQE